MAAAMKWSMLSAVTFIAAENRLSLTPTYETDETTLTAAAQQAVDATALLTASLPSADRALRAIRRWALAVCREQVDAAKWKSSTGVLPPAAVTVEKQLRVLSKGVLSRLPSEPSAANGPAANTGPVAGPRRALFDNVSPPLPRISLP